MNPRLLGNHKIKLTAGGVLLASVLLFGFNGTIHRLTVGADQIRSFVNDHASADHLIAVGKKQLADAERSLLEAEAGTKGHRSREQRIRDEISHLELSALTARSRLETLRPAVTANAGFNHCGSVYSATEVKEDAMQLANFVKDCEAQAALKRQELQSLQQTLAQGDSVLRDARTAFSQAQRRFKELEIKLKQQEAVKEATAAARAARDGVAEDLGTDFAGTLAALERRIRGLQTQNESLRSADGALPAGNIPFESRSGADVEALVNDVLGPQKAATAQAR